MRQAPLLALVLLASMIFAACEDEKDPATYCGEGTKWNGSECVKGKKK